VETITRQNRAAHGCLGSGLAHGL